MTIREVRQSPDGRVAVHLELESGPLTESGPVWIEVFPQYYQVGLRHLKAGDVADWWPLIPDPKHVVSRVELERAELTPVETYPCGAVAIDDGDPEDLADVVGKFEHEFRAAGVGTQKLIGAVVLREGQTVSAVIELVTFPNRQEVHGTLVDQEGHVFGMNIWQVINPERWRGSINGVDPAPAVAPVLGDKPLPSVPPEDIADHVVTSDPGEYWGED